MSIQRTTSVTCPECGKQFQTTIFESLNTDYSPDVAKAVIRGDYFNCNCPSCGYLIHISYDCLYHDITHSAMIWLVDRENPEARRKINDIRSNLTPDIKTTRIVEDVNALREKVSCLEAGRDDRVVEICKVFLESELLNQHPDVQIKRSLYTLVADTEMVFICDTKGNEFHTQLDEDIYHSFLELIERQSSPVEESPYQIIDREWAESFLEKLDDGLQEENQNLDVEDDKFSETPTTDMSARQERTRESRKTESERNLTSEENAHGIGSDLVKILIWVGFIFGYGLCVTLLRYAGIGGALIAVLVGAGAIFGAKQACAAFEKRIASHNQENQRIEKKKANFQKNSQFPKQSKNKKQEKTKSNRKCKPISIVLLCVAGLVLIACGVYFGTYFAAKSNAYNGEYEKAQNLLLFPALTNVLNPELEEYISNGFAYEKAVKELTDGDIRAYQTIEPLVEKQFPPAIEKQSENKKKAYEVAVKYYRDHDNKMLAAKVFALLGDYKNSEDYLTLYRKSNYSAIIRLIGFEDASDILIGHFSEKFLKGSWKTSDEKYYFTMTSKESTYNLPAERMDNAYYSFTNTGDYYIYRETGKNERITLFHFSIIDANTLSIYCYLDGSTHTLFRQ